MNITHLPKDVSISISGKHYFGCDYIFANIYGSSIFAEDESEHTYADEESFKSLSNDPESGDFSKETIEKFINSDSGDSLDLSTLPDVNKEIEYSTLGTLQSDGKGGYLIRYSGDFSPICIHAEDERITLNGQEDDFSELIFEKGKRNYICLPESIFSEEVQEENENQSPIMLCLSAECVENNLKESGGSLHVSYSIEVNGITAEVTDFTLTAISGGTSL